MSEFAVKNNTESTAEGHSQAVSTDKGFQKPDRSPKFRMLPIQGKLSIGTVDDPLEKEADAMADQVMRMPENGLIQRKCVACEEEDHIRRAPLSSFIQKKGATSGVRASEAVSNQIQATRGQGSSLPRATTNFMESRFGADFSNVNIHTGSNAVQMSRELGAKAFTVGNDIYFNQGQYDPNSNSGKHLLAHELTHTIQQGGSSSTSQNKIIQRDEFTPWPGQTGNDVPGTRNQNGNILSEQVQRIGDPTYSQLGPMLLEFDSDACTLTVRKEINFVRAGSGDDQLSQEEFDALKNRILEIAREKLNGWVSINMTSSQGCGLNCPNGIRVIVVTTEGSGSYSSRLNLHRRFGREDAQNIGDDASDRTLWHELGHIVLGAADEYPEANRPDGTPRPDAQVNQEDWSIMSSGSGGRRQLMHARHFSHLTAWLSRRFPNCTFSLNELARPMVIEFTPSLVLGGYFDTTGSAGLHYSLGLDLGIPFDRLRRLEFILGPRINLITAGELDALLLGFRAGLEGQFASEGFRLGGYVEGGGVGFDFTSEAPIDAIPYFEAGLNSNYSFGGMFNLGLEIGTGGREMPTLDGTEFRQYFRFGLNIGGSF